jgi:hypothetical protein
VVVTVVYLSRASAWEQQLPQEVRELVVPTQKGADKDMSLLRKTGHYRNFPHFNTANPSLDAVGSALLLCSAPLRSSCKKSLRRRLSSAIGL